MSKLWTPKYKIRPVDCFGPKLLDPSKIQTLNRILVELFGTSESEDFKSFPKT